MEVSFFFQIILWLLFSVACYYRLSFMMHSRAKWFHGAIKPEETKWIIVQVITPCLPSLLATLIRAIFTPRQWSSL
jgi:hypothetical protein